jgi:hypothetical protein
MYRSRRFLFLCLAAVVVGLAVGGWLLWPSRSVITPENALTIEVGMALADVEGILGGPPRDESTGRLRATMDHDKIGGHDTRLVFAKSRAWVSDRAIVEVFFNEDGRVSATHILRARPAEHELINSVRRCLGL